MGDETLKPQPHSNVERSTAPVYQTMMDYVAEGIIPGTVVIHDGENTLTWTAGVTASDGWKPADDFDAFAAALISLKRAKREAERAGYHVVS